MKRWQAILSTGFAMFSMFFGSGNLVFPLLVGRENSQDPTMASIGIFLTGILVPFLGLWGMYLSQGSREKFFSCFGKQGLFLFTFCALALMGPFGVLARCLTVAYGSFQLLFPSVSLPLFSLITCGVIFILTYNKTRIISLLGAWLTPVFLAALGAIIVASYWHEPLTAANATSQPLTALLDGVFKGYQTMDLLAAFFFCAFVMNHLANEEKTLPEEERKGSIFLPSAIVGMSLLSVIYTALVYFGSLYQAVLVDVRPESLLGTVAKEALGTSSVWTVCVTVLLACITTAMVLAMLFAEFISKELMPKRVSEKSCLVITLAIAFGVSTMEFQGIARFLGPILETVYPALITLSVFNIGASLLNYDLAPEKVRWPVAATLVTKCFMGLI